MLSYIGLRIFQAFLGLWFIATLVFILSRSIGDPAEIFTARHGHVHEIWVSLSEMGYLLPKFSWKDCQLPSHLGYLR